MTDDELIAGCLAGRKESWELFCERFSKLIHWSVRETLSDSSFRDRPDLREDIFQEIFRKLLDREELGRLRQAQSVRKFLAVMACHATMDRMKKLRREEVLRGSDEEALQRLNLDIAEGAASREHREILSGGLATLRPQERAALEFYYLEGLSHRSIGELLGLTEDSIEALIRRTREKMKGLLKERGLEL